MNEILTFISEKQITKIAILCDEKVWDLYPNYFHFLKYKVEVFYISVEAKEKNKNIDELNYIWNYLLEQKFDRNSLLINWGGGIISDIGGFVAATFKRGLNLINVPTTLLAMIDAAHGGKNGVNLQHQKNIIGTFYLPNKVIIDHKFLRTLNKKELLNGFAELIKYALIGNENLWNEFQKINEINYKIIKKEWIDFCVQYKTKLVEEDLYDKGKRQILNFGHTVGHAIERLYSKQNRKISHGHAVAIGIFFEVELSLNNGFITKEKFDEIQDFILKFYKIPDFTEIDKTKIAEYILDDKKNKNGGVGFIYLEKTENQK